MPVGHPTDYDPKYCNMLIKHMASGMSFESFAAVIDVSRATLYNWEKAHPEFLDAKSRGVDKNLQFYESLGAAHIVNEKDGPQLNTTLWYINMKNRHGWRDKREMEVSEAPEKEKLKKLSTAELEKLVKEIIEERKD